MDYYENPSFYLVCPSFPIFLLCLSYRAKLRGFLNVGQGDSTLIKHGSVELVIDGGPVMLLSDKISKYLSYGDKTIEVAELSHTDSDHYKGFLELSKSIKLNLYYAAQIEESADLSQLLAQLGGQGTNIVTAKEGLEIRAFPRGFV